MVVKALLNFIAAIVGIFKKLMCFLNIKKGRRNSGSILPLHGDITGKQNPVTQSLPSNDHADLELESWDSWGDTGSGGQNTGNQTGKHAGNHAANQGQGGYYGNRVNGVNPAPTEEKEEVDFFGDMTPQIRKQQKILIRKKEESSQRNEGFSKRFAVGSEIPLEGGPDLGAWEEGESAWGEELSEDLSWEAKSAIKERKRVEREQRQMEQLRRKQEKEAQRTQRGAGVITAVKLS